MSLNVTILCFCKIPNKSQVVTKFHLPKSRLHYIRKKMKYGTLHMSCLFSLAVLIRPIGLEYKRKIGWFAQKTRAPETAEKVQLQSLFYSFLIVNCCYSGKKPWKLILLINTGPVQFLQDALHWRLTYVCTMNHKTRPLCPIDPSILFITGLL